MKCPFFNNRAIETQSDPVNCVYMDSYGDCEDLEICPGNSDAWCIERINASQPEDSADKVLRKLEMYKETRNESYLDKAISLLNG